MVDDRVPSTVSCFRLAFAGTGKISGPIFVLLYEQQPANLYSLNVLDLVYDW
jgi:hypothetical protein